MIENTLISIRVFKEKHINCYLQLTKLLIHCSKLYEGLLSAADIWDCLQVFMVPGTATGNGSLCSFLCENSFIYYNEKSCVL